MHLGCHSIRRSMTMTMIFCACLLLWGACANLDASRDLDQVTEAFVRGHSRRLDLLTSRYTSLVDRLADVSRNRHSDTVSQLLTSLSSADQYCRKGQVQCGKSPQCISKLFFCDDVIDCDNAYDESPARCENPLPENSTWKGYPVYDWCNAGPSVSGLTIQGTFLHILDVVENPYFKETLKIVALVEFFATSPTVNLEISMPIVGSYSRGDRMFILHAPRTDGIGLRAEFHGRDSYRHNHKRSFTADIMYETSGIQCAEYLYVRVT